MAMQTDVKSKYVNSTGASSVGARVRIRAVYYVGTGTAGSVSFREGGVSGDELLKFDTVASATTGSGFMIVPAEGILFSGDPYVTLTNVTSVTFFYG